MTINTSTTQTRKKEIIKIQNLSKIYTRGEIKVNAINNLDATFFTNEISLIIGPSGCGKTTLLNILAGLVDISAGNVFVSGKAIEKMSESEWDAYRLNNIGYIFQFFNLISDITAKENIMIPLTIQKKTPQEIEAIISSLAVQFGMEMHLDHYPSELSGGQQQKIALIMNIAKNPAILLCDEPTGELDSKSKKEVMEFLLSIKQKYPEKAIIIVSHDVKLRFIADRIFHIRDGKISFVQEISDEERTANLKLFHEGFDSIDNFSEDIKNQIQETIYFLQKQIKK